MKRKLSCMGIVVARDESSSILQILMMENDGEFVFPKGHVEPNENNLDATIREVYEETGIIVTKEDHLGKVDQFEFYFEGEQAIKVIEVHLFCIRETKPATPNTNEGIISVFWLPLPEALQKISHNDARDALHKALEKL